MPASSSRGWASTTARATSSRRSGGLARRVEIAKALLGAPKVLLLDEPSTGLDPLARRSLRALLAELARGGTTVLLTTHLFDEAEEAGASASSTAAASSPSAPRPT